MGPNEIWPGQLPTIDSVREQIWAGWCDQNDLGLFNGRHEESPIVRKSIKSFNLRLNLPDHIIWSYVLYALRLRQAVRTTVSPFWGLRTFSSSGLFSRRPLMELSDIENPLHFLSEKNSKNLMASSIDRPMPLRKRPYCSLPLYFRWCWVSIAIWKYEKSKKIINLLQIFKYKSWPLFRVYSLQSFIQLQWQQMFDDQ